jgi:hypothetical protein
MTRCHVTSAIDADADTIRCLRRDKDDNTMLTPVTPSVTTRNTRHVDDEHAMSHPAKALQPDPRIPIEHPQRVNSNIFNQ